VIDTLYQVSRLLIRASLALFTCVVLVLIQSAFWSTRVSAWMQVIIFAIALLSYFRPHWGLFALAVLAPLGQVGSRTLDSQMRGAEALVLAFLAGALVRGWTLREFRTFPSTRLHVAALIFGFLVAASWLEQIWLTQIQSDFAWPFLQEVFAYASRNYLTSFRFGSVFHAMLLLEGLALLVYVARYTRERPDFGQRLAVTIVAGAVGTAVLTIWHAFSELMQTGQPGEVLLERLAATRWVTHTTDINAAGSFFAMGMFIAVGMALRKSPSRFPWVAAACLLAVTTLMTHSRTAIAALLLILVCLATAAMLGRIIGVRRAVAIAATASIALVIALWNYLGPEYFGREAAAAIRIRWLFLGTTWRMLVAEPLFGLGIGQYFLWSRHFASPELLFYYQRENAHNNFAQIAGELGLAGLISFVAVLVAALWRRGEERLEYKVATPVLLGLAAFILTWLGGHPLLVAEVAYPFWLTLGIGAAVVARDSKANVSAVIAGVAMALLVVSVPFRVSAKSAELDFTRVTYGVSARQLMTSHVRLFVPGAESRIDIPLRARSASEDVPVEIEVLVDGSASETIALHDRNLRKAPISLPRDPSRRFHQIDLLIRPHALDSVDPDRSLVEVGKWEIISKPNG
jgi:O-Antigen ligase